MSVVGVKINNKGRILYYESGTLDLRVGLNIIVDTDRGYQYAKIVNFLNSNLCKGLNFEKKIIRISQKSDYYQHLNNLKDAEKALIKCKELINKYKLNMKVIDSCYTFDRSQLIFRFLADERVDFRNLARELGSLYKTRIELRQVGVRDKAKDIGAIGSCGRTICCNKFLNNFDTITINMAKNQMLALNPSKINGVCGRLFCCLGYENDNYLEVKKNIPNIGEIVIFNNMKCKVISTDLLNNKYCVEDDNNNFYEVDLKNDCKE